MEPTPLRRSDRPTKQSPTWPQVANTALGVLLVGMILTFVYLLIRL